MTKTRLLAAVCTVSLLAVGAARAQGDSHGMPTPGATPSAGMSGSSMGAPPHASTPSGSSMGNSGSMAPHHAASGATGKHAGMMSSGAQDEHGTAHANRHAMRDSSRPDAQNAEVDRLNQQSLDAARQGKDFSASGTGGSDAGANGASGSSSGMMSPGGKM